MTTKYTVDAILPFKHFSNNTDWKTLGFNKSVVLRLQNSVLLGKNLLTQTLNLPWRWYQLLVAQNLTPMIVPAVHNWIFDNSRIVLRNWLKRLIRNVDIRQYWSSSVLVSWIKSTQCFKHPDYAIRPEYLVTMISVRFDAISCWKLVRMTKRWRTFSFLRVLLHLVYGAPLSSIKDRRSLIERAPSKPDRYVHFWRAWHRIPVVKLGPQPRPCVCLKQMIVCKQRIPWRKAVLHFLWCTFQVKCNFLFIF